MKLLLTVFLLPLFLSFSCATSIGANDLKLGMTQEQVIDVIGKPKQVRASFAIANKPVEMWEYEFYELNDWRLFWSVAGFGIPFLWRNHLDSYYNYLFFAGNRLEGWSTQSDLAVWVKAYNKNQK